MGRNAFLCLVAVCAGVCAQEHPADGPHFEVASIKPSQASADVGFMQGMGGDPAFENYTNIALRTLILRAYKIKDYQLTGPDWMAETLFNVRAKIREGVSRDQVPLMMQTLLAERFHLSLHRETKELPVYDLVVAKGGIKTSPPEERFLPKPNRDGTITIRGTFSAAGEIHLEGRPITMESLVEILCPAAERPVFDKTGLTGSYEFKMSWPNAEGTPLADELKKSLGLALEAHRAPVEILIVDRVEKVPVEN